MIGRLRGTIVAKGHDQASLLEQVRSVAAHIRPRPS